MVPDGWREMGRAGDLTLAAWNTQAGDVRPARVGEGLEPLADPALAAAVFVLSLLPLLSGSRLRLRPGAGVGLRAGGGPVPAAGGPAALAVRRCLAVGATVHGLRRRRPAGPAGLLRGLVASLHRRRARVAAQGQRRRRASPRSVCSAWSSGTGPTPTTRTWSSTARCSPPPGCSATARATVATRRRAGGARRAARAHPRRRGGGGGRRRAQPHRPRAARRRRPPRQPDGRAGRGRPGGAATRDPQRRPRRSTRSVPWASRR